MISSFYVYGCDLSLDLFACVLAIDGGAVETNGVRIHACVEVVGLKHVAITPRHEAKV